MLSDSKSDVQAATPSPSFYWGCCVGRGRRFILTYFYHPILFRQLKWGWEKRVVGYFENMNTKALIKCLVVAKAALENDYRFAQKHGSPDDATLNSDALYHVESCLAELMPCCPNCGSKDKVIISPKPEYGTFFCPCNKPGPQYFNFDGSGHIVAADEFGSVSVTKVPAPATDVDMCGAVGGTRDGRITAVCQQPRGHTGKHGGMGCEWNDAACVSAPSSK